MGQVAPTDLHGELPALFPQRAFFIGDMFYNKGSFTIVPNKEALRGLDPQTQVLFMWICSYADDNGVCWPSIGRLCVDCGMSRRTVFNRLEKLLSLGFIQKKHRLNDAGDKDSNKYRIRLLDGSAGDALGVVHEVHHGSARGAHKLNTINSNNLTQDKNFVFEDATRLAKIKTLEYGVY